MSSNDLSYEDADDASPDGDERGEPEPEPLSKDIVFELLKNRRRRKVLEYLLSVEGTVTLSDLAEQIAAWENDTTVEALSSDQRKRVYVALYQTHLPKMNDAGVIEYNQNRGHITLSENAELLTMYLDADTDASNEWPIRYLGLSAAGLVVVAAALVGVPGVAVVPPLAIAAVVLGTLLVISLVHTYTMSRERIEVEDKLARIE